MSTATLTINEELNNNDNIVLPDILTKFIGEHSIFRKTTVADISEHSSTTVHHQDNIIIKDEPEESWKDLYNIMYKSSRNESEEEEQIFEEYFSKFEVK